MRVLLLMLFVSSVLTDKQIAKGETKKDLKNSIDEPKSKTGKRDSSVQTASFGINPNDEPFKPMLNSPAPFEAAASDSQQATVYYDKNAATAGEGAVNAKGGTNHQTANAYRGQYSQVPHQQTQQQQQNKNNLRVAAKNVGIQQQNQPSILYAVPQNPAYHYERTPQQQQQPQQQIQIQSAAALSPAQRGPQKQIQYVVAIPLSYLRQLQQQLIHQQQQEQPLHLQVYKGQQQPQQQQQLQPTSVYSIAGPLARDNHGAYRPFHRFAPVAVNDVSTGAQHQTNSPGILTQPLVPNSPAPPGYITQFVQIPSSVLLAAVQSAQVQQQQRPFHVPQTMYQQPSQQQLQQPQFQLQLQQPIHQQHVQTQSPQLYYYQPQPQQQQQQQVQLKQSQPSHALTSPPVYALHVNQQQPQQPTQQHQTFQHLTEQQQQQQQNVGKQPHRVRGVRPTANFSPSQYDSSAAAYESEEKAQVLTLQAPAHPNFNAHNTHTNAHSQQYIAQAPAVNQQHQQQTSPAHQLVEAPTSSTYAHYSPHYVQHYQELQQQQRPHTLHQPHRLQLQPQQHTPLVEHVNNLPFSQAIHSTTPLSFLRLHQAPAVGPLFNLPSQPFLTGAFQPPFTPLGTPSKVTSFTNVLLQPFVGHSSDIGTAVAGSADSLPFVHQTGGIRYGTQLYHPPTSATTILAGNKQHNSVSSPVHPAPRVLNTAGNEGKASASSAKTISGSPTIVKYP